MAPGAPLAQLARMPDIEFLEIEHVQLGMPSDGADAARAFYAGTLGMPEIPRPSALGGLWFRAGGVELHLREEEGFRAGARAHPGIRVRGLQALAARLVAAGHTLRPDLRYPGRSRFYVADPFGNQLEFLELHDA